MVDEIDRLLGRGNERLVRNLVGPSPEDSAAAADASDEQLRQAIDAPEPARPVRNANGECVHCGQIEGKGPHGPDCVWTPL